MESRGLGQVLTASGLAHGEILRPREVAPWCCWGAKQQMCLVQPPPSWGPRVFVLFCWPARASTRLFPLATCGR